MKRYKLIHMMLFAMLTSCVAPDPMHANKVVLDQQQLVYNGGLSARSIAGYSVWQSFTPAFSGKLIKIDMGFFNEMSGSGTVNLYLGEETTGDLIQTLQTNITATDGGISWNSFGLSSPILAEKIYTFEFVPNSSTIPDPYGVCIASSQGAPPPAYSRGTGGLTDPSGSYMGSYCLVFRTYVIPNATTRMDSRQRDMLLSQHDEPRMEVEQAPPIDEVQQAITTIINVKELSFGVADGVHNQCEIAVAINSILSSREPDTALLDAFNRGTLYGKLYVLVAMRKINKEESDRLSKMMTENHDKEIWYSVGCVFDKTTIGNIMDFIRQGRFDNMMDVW